MNISRKDNRLYGEVQWSLGDKAEICRLQVLYRWAYSDRAQAKASLAASFKSALGCDTGNFDAVDVHNRLEMYSQYVMTWSSMGRVSRRLSRNVRNDEMSNWIGAESLCSDWNVV